MKTFEPPTGNGDFLTITTKPTKDVIQDDITDLISKCEKEQCVMNSILIAEKFGAKIVEGVTYVIAFKQEVGCGDHFIRHAWNKIGEDYFDVSADYVWPMFELTDAKYYYIPLAEYDFAEYNPVGTDKFMTNAVEIANKLNAASAAEKESEENGEKIKNDDTKDSPELTDDDNEA